MHPEPDYGGGKGTRHKKQAIILFLVATIGGLCFCVHIYERKYGLALILGVATTAVVLLGVWLWRQSNK